MLVLFCKIYIFISILQIGQWDGVAYGVNHRRTPVVCPISSSQCRPQSGRWSAISTSTLKSMETTALCPCIQAQCIGRNCHHLPDWGLHRLEKIGHTTRVLRWSPPGFQTISKLMLALFCKNNIFIFHFTDWADGVAYGVDHRRTQVVCPIS